MKAAIHLIAAAWAAALVVPASAEDSPRYGRAGGSVGSERIAQIVRTATPAPAHLDPGYGRAGGPIATAQAGVPKHSTEVRFAADWYGRAGRPLPFGS